MFSDITEALLYLMLAPFVVSEVTNVHRESMEKFVIARCSSDRRCICYNDTNNHSIADCSFKNITHVPLFDKDVRVIYLQHNAIENIHNSSYMCGFPKYLLYLDLSFNRLSNLTGNPFVNLTLLHSLNMSNNNLVYSADMYPPNLFHDLKNLRHIEIQANNPQNIGLTLSYPLAISKLERLESIYLDGVDERGFGTQFRSLTMLKTVSMNGHTGVCALVNILEHFFSNLPQLTNITLSKCSTRNIEKGTFMHLTKLTYLNISHNMRLTFKVLANVSSDLQKTTISVLDITNIHCQFGPGNILFKADLIGLNNTRLKQIYCDDNRLVIAEQGIVQMFPSTLELISLRRNRLSFGCYLLLLYALPMKVILADDQYPERHFTILQNVDCGDWRGPTTGMGSDASCGAFTHLNADSGMLPIPFPKHLQTFTIDNSAQQNVIPAIGFIDTHLKYVSARHNILFSWIGPISGMNRLETIDLSFNFCKFVSKDFFSHFPSLRFLFIGNNPLGGILQDDYEGLIFRHLHQLELLDLPSMQLRELPRLIFHNQIRLHILNLSGNSIENFNVSIQHMRKLRTLDLSDNRISAFGQDITKQIDTIKHVKINLTGNALICSCGNIAFVEWLNINQGKFHNFKSNTCSFGGQNSSFANFHVLLDDLKRSCANHSFLIAVMSACIAASMTIIIGGLVYRYRWKLRYLYYMSKTRSRGYIPVRQNDDQYLYDAFVSYSETESVFVRTNLLEKLETNHQLKLCLHQRDFLPGMAIADNITGAMNQSRKSIFILSRGFLKSKWCNFEYNMARMENLYSRAGEDIVILIMYERVPVTDLSCHMLEQIESESYLEYPDDEEGLVVFWDNLYRAL